MLTETCKTWRILVWLILAITLTLAVSPPACCQPTIEIAAKLPSTVAPDSLISIEVYAKNPSTETVYDPVVSIYSLSPSYVRVVGSTIVNLSGITIPADGKWHLLTGFLIQVSGETPPGTYSLLVSISYKYLDTTWKTSSASETFYFIVKEPPVLKIGNFSVTPVSVAQGERINIRATIRNSGEGEATNTTAYLLVDGVRESYVYVGTINPGESRELKFSWKVPVNYPPGTHEVKLEVKCNETGSVFSDSILITVKEAQPLLDLTVTVTKVVAQGGVLTADVTVINRGCKPATGVKVILLFDNLEVAERSVGRLEGDGVASLRLEWRVPHDVSTGLYNVEVKVVSNELNPISRSFTVEVTIGAKSRAREAILSAGENLSVANMVLANLSEEVKLKDADALLSKARSLYEQAVIAFNLDNYSLAINLAGLASEYSARSIQKAFNLVKSEVETLILNSTEVAKKAELAGLNTDPIYRRVEPAKDHLGKALDALEEANYELAVYEAKKALFFAKNAYKTAEAINELLNNLKGNVKQLITSTEQLLSKAIKKLKSMEEMGVKVPSAYLSLKLANNTLNNAKNMFNRGFYVEALEISKEAKEKAEEVLKLLSKAEEEASKSKEEAENLINQSFKVIDRVKGVVNEMEMLGFNVTSIKSSLSQVENLAKKAKELLARGKYKDAEKEAGKALGKAYELLEKAEKLKESYTQKRLTMIITLVIVVATAVVVALVAVLIVRSRSRGAPTG